MRARTITFPKTKNGDSRAVPMTDTVMALLGHRDPRMTLGYQHLSPEHLRDAVRVLDKRLTATTVEAVGQA